jgi:hypothetical protein
MLQDDIDSVGYVGKVCLCKFIVKICRQSLLVLIIVKMHSEQYVVMITVLPVI